MRLIDADALYERATTLEAQALDYVGKLIERDGDELSVEWKIWSAILAERTAFKHDLMDAPTVDRPQGEWVPCSERLPSDGQNVIIQYYDTTEKNHVSVVGACYDNQQGFVDTGYEEMWFGNGNDDVIAWMPLPEPWKGANNEID